MSERTEQLILLLTPEEKARIERVARKLNQSETETIIEGVDVLEARLDDDDEDDEAILESIRQGLRDVKAGRVYSFNSIRELLDSPDDEDDELG